MTDDRVLRVTKVVSAAIIPVLTAAFAILYLFPGHTHQLWAWTIPSRMTVMLMGGGYLAGAYFFTRAVLTRQWHLVGWGFPAITVFATVLGITTFLHWDKFNHGHVSFWAWTFLYVSTPVLLPFLWLRNRRFDPVQPAPDDRLVPEPVRVIMVTVGALQLLVAAAMFVRPSLFLDRWPWPITPLTCRTLSGFVAFPAVAYLSFAFDRRASSFRVPIETAAIGLVLIGVAAVRAAGEFRGSDFLIWGWRIGLVVALGLMIALRALILEGSTAPQPDRPAAVAGTPQAGPGPESASA